jgi:hypothetical protein
VGTTTAAFVAVRGLSTEGDRIEGVHNEGNVEGM